MPAPARAITKSGSITSAITSESYTCGNFVLWMPVEYCARSPKRRISRKKAMQHIRSVLITILTYAKNERALNGANPVDGVLIPGMPKIHAYDLGEAGRSWFYTQRTWGQLSLWCRADKQLLLLLP